MANFGISQNNIPVVNREIENNIMVALEACGLQAERYAKMLCPVDTGLLRNSITHAVGGSALRGNYRASYGENTYKDRSGNVKRYTAGSRNAGSVRVGNINVNVGQQGDHTVYIATNVYYAPYVEMGHITPSGKHTPPKPFLRPAISGHQSVYKGIIKRYLKGQGNTNNS